MNKTKTNKGITLVALVITIIVLIILAGVSINAVLNGGIIKNAKDAKNEYNVGKQNEVESLSTLKGYISDVKAEEVKKDFANAGIECTFKNSYLTGIEPRTAIEGFSLPKGYKLCKADGGDLTDETYLATGMIIKKDNKEVGRVVIYGDTGGTYSDGKFYGDGFIDVSDFGPYNHLFKGKNVEDYIKVAMDVTHDGNITKDDEEFENKIINGAFVGIPQNVEAPDPDIIKVEQITAKEKYLANFPIGEYNFIWSDFWDAYLLQGVTIGETTVAELIDALPEGTVITDEYGNIKESTEKIADYDGVYLNNVYIGDNRLYEIGWIENL